MSSRSREIMVVFVGGAIGTTLRWLIGLGLTAEMSTTVVNLVGAFLMGVLVTQLPKRVEEEDRRRLWQLGLGTGLLGGFTTYGSMAVLATFSPSIGFGIVSVGWLLAWLGTKVAA